MKIKNLYPIIILFCIGLVLAKSVDTQIQQFPEGYLIVESQHNYLKLGRDYTYNFFVYNITTGATVDNSSISCIFYLANSSGKLLFEDTANYNPLGYWELIILGGNFTEKDYYPYGVKCNDVNGGGSLSGIFEINPLGRELTEPKSKQYILIFIVSCGFLISFLISGILIKGDYKRDELYGYIIAKNNLKYLKYFFFALSYVSFVFVSYLLWMMSYAFLDFEFISSIMRFVFTISAVGLIPFFILYFYFNIASIIKDMDIADNLKRGIRVR